MLLGNELPVIFVKYWHFDFHNFPFTFVRLKKAVLIFLALQFASNNSFAEELLRLPALFSHYRHHTTEHRDISDFSDFLYLHYANQSHQDNDQEHHGLPFKHSAGDCSVMHLSSLGFLPSFNANLSLYPNTTLLFFSVDESIPSVEWNCIWQPPKLG